MNKLLVLSVLGIGLALTNPSHKERYVVHVSHQIQDMLCQPEFPRANTCTLLSPITKPVIKGVLSLYTEPPKNYVLFTTYITRLPGFEVYGVGVGGQFVIWSPQAIAPQDYEQLLDALLNAQTNHSPDDRKCDRPSDSEPS